MRTVTRETGFSPAVLRAWERRYDLLHPKRGPGGHRLFTTDDLAVLKLVRRRMHEGRSIGEIALAGRDGLLAEARDVTAGPQPGSEPATMEALRTRAIAATLELDAAGIELVLDEAFARVAPTQVIQELIEPVALEIGEHWAHGRCTVAHEHLTSGIFRHRLRKLVETSARRSTNRRPVIFACLPDELHDLGLLALAYQCAQHGIHPCYLGPSLPFEDLEAACDQLRPTAIVLSVTRRATYDMHQGALLDVVRRLAAATRILVGGQGTPSEDRALSAAGARLFRGERSREVLLAELIG